MHLVSMVEHTSISLSVSVCYSTSTAYFYFYSAESLYPQRVLSREAQDLTTHHISGIKTLCAKFLSCPPTKIEYRFLSLLG